MGTYIIRDVQDFLIERWGQKQMRSDVDLQLAAHAKQVRLENAQLREQNRVLAEAFAKTTKGKVTINRYEHGGGRMFVDDGKNRDLIADTYNEGDREFIALCYEVFSKQAALTATSQPQPPYKEWCRHPDKCAGLASCPQDPTCAD